MTKQRAKKVGQTKGVEQKGEKWGVDAVPRSLGFLKKSAIKFHAPPAKVAEKPLSTLFVFGKKLELAGRLSHWKDWQKAEFEGSADLINGTGQQGPETALIGWKRSEKESEHYGRLEKSGYGYYRDSIGGWVSKTVAHQRSLSIELVGLNDSELLGALVGIEMATYSFKSTQSDPVAQIYVTGPKGKDLTKKQIDSALTIARGVNLARHLVNLPARTLNPKSYSEAVTQIFKGVVGVKVDVWSETQLKREGMGLLLGVGAAADTPPCLVHIKYRPSGAKKGQAPLAFVGKGVTYDTGGLDLKPSTAMNLMKKDMGGSAAIVGLAYWVTHAKIKQSCDFYLPMAENAVSSSSFRPGDILTARNGKTIEIDNTDAEGRLILADALDVAGTAKSQPACIVDVATLTGAVKVGLGAEIPGLFSNSDRLAEKIEKSWSEKSELLWRLPLYRKAMKPLTSTVADWANSAGGFGGAIRAALFLEAFVPNNIPWAHVDIYAWADAAEGALAERGGSGQAVQGLIDFIQNY